MYPLCCIDIRNFLKQIYLFSDDLFKHSTIIDDTLRNVSKLYSLPLETSHHCIASNTNHFVTNNNAQSLDELLTDRVCRLLLEQLSSQYPGQIVQILTNLGHFETACHELEALLTQARAPPSSASTSSASGQRSASSLSSLPESRSGSLSNTAASASASASASLGRGPVVLEATEQFHAGKKTAEKRIFELVNSKIDDLIETAEYDW